MAKKWNVKVTANPDFCGIDAGGVQFAHGEAEIEDKRLAQWFKKHKGYEVTEVKAEKKAENAKKAGEKKPEGGDGDKAADSGAQASADGDNAGGN